MFPTTAPFELDECFSAMDWPLVPAVPRVILSAVSVSWMDDDWLLMATDIMLQESWTSSGSDPPEDSANLLAFWEFAAEYSLQCPGVWVEYSLECSPWECLEWEEITAELDECVTWLVIGAQTVFVVLIATC